MYQSRIMAALDALSPDDDLENAADARTLTALAAFFDAQAKRFREAAEEKRARERNAEHVRRSRERAHATYLRLGARLAVLSRRLGRDEAIAVMMERTRMSAEQLAKARTTWSRLRIRRKLHTRNVAIYKAKLAGETSRALAARYGLTVRQIDKAAADIERAILKLAPERP